MLRSSLSSHRGMFVIRCRWHLILLVTLMAFHALNNWAWLSTNVVIINSDARRHLMTSLAYSDVLKPLNLSNLFYTVTVDEFRPPLFQLSAVPLLWLLGRSTDIATMVNALYMVVLLAATYAIGRKMFDRNVGLLTAFVLSTFPTIYAMSRYYYIDSALTAVVALNLALLLHTKDFERKGYTLSYGLSLGLGMLVKWTFVVFALAPAVLVLLRSGLPQRMITEVRTAKLDVKWALLSVLLALGLVLMWYLPNLHTVREMFLGLWLLPLAWVTLALTSYALSRPSSQAANFFGALMAGFSVASIWYLPRMDFLRTFFLAVARHSHGGLQNSLGYLRLLENEQLSAFYVIVLIWALLIPVLAKRELLRGVMRRDVLLGDLAAMVSWAVFPFCVFSFRASSLHSRYTMPMLPPLALLIGWGLLSVPWRKIKIALLAIVVIVALTQFFALSYDGLEWVRDGAVVQLPGGRQFNLFAHGFENQLPSTGVTDTGYWTVPDMLRFMREDSRRIGRQKAELGILMKTHYVQASTFELVSLAEGYSELRVRELARAWSDAPVYPQLFEVDYLVLKDGSQKGINREETRELVDALLSGSSPFLGEVFEVAQQYPMPDGDTVYLYRKKYHLDKEYSEDDYRTLARDLEAIGGGDEAILFEIPEQIEVFARYYQGGGTPYPLPRQHPLDEGATLLELETMAANHDTIFAVLMAEEQLDAGHFVEGWLNRYAYRALTSWYGPVRLMAYASPLAEEGDGPAHRIEAGFGEFITFLGFSLHGEEARSGQILRIKLFWKADDSVEKDYKIFLHLLDAEGQIVAQQDSRPVGGSRPTTDWVEGETIADNHGVFIPWGVAPGQYQLVLGMYEPNTGQRLSATADGGVVGDTLPLTLIRIEDS
jgi:4-amino-4-deoxy-L-arabinose transferase-like glycosyltransferase